MRRLPLRSPPRVRGKVWLHQKPGRVPGITPAYAGKSPPAKRKNPAIWDHPRVCGEKLYWHQLRCTGAGSPPRMRGKGVQPCDERVRVRITPACAGKRLLRQLRHITSRDHPRVCGEKPGGRLRELVYPGSPPRMRGKGVQPRNKRVAMRITPAYAGKSALQRIL